MTTDLPEQSEIIRRLTIDRDEALAHFFSLVDQRLKRIVNFRLDYRLNGRISDSDVIQDTFVRASQRLDSFLEKPEMPFFVWLRLEVQQQLVDIHRHHFGAEKRDIRKEVAIVKPPAGQTSLAIAAHLVAQMTSVSKLFEKAEQIAMVEKSLDEMNELDREVIALRHFEELSNLETAEVLGIQPAAASKRYLRALKRLREIMERVKEMS
jgi:RNA polymerase sigma-70 factor (ECF subfamily)